MSHGVRFCKVVSGQLPRWRWPEGCGPAAGAAAAPRFPGDPGPKRLYYGAATDLDLLAWERRLGQRLSLRRSFHRPSAPQALVDMVGVDLRYNRLPHPSTKCPGTWADVALGRQDAWLRSLGTKLAAFNRPTLITFHHEPENDSGAAGMTAADFVAMQTRIISMYAAIAPKVTVVPILQGWSFDLVNNPGVDTAPWKVPAARILGVDSYNPFSAVNPTWIPFEQRLLEFRKFAGDKPIAVGEYAVREDPAVPGRAGQWMRDAFTFARGQQHRGDVLLQLGQ